MGWSLATWRRWRRRAIAEVCGCCRARRTEGRLNIAHLPVGESAATTRSRSQPNQSAAQAAARRLHLRREASVGRTQTEEDSPSTLFGGQLKIGHEDRSLQPSLAKLSRNSPSTHILTEAYRPGPTKDLRRLLRAARAPQADFISSKTPVYPNLCRPRPRVPPSHTKTRSLAPQA